MAIPGVQGSNFAPAACGARPANFLFGCGKLGLDIMQLVIAPGVAYQVTPRHSIGVAPLLVAQRFKVYGLQSFAAFSKHPTEVSNRGKDWALGVGGARRLAGRDCAMAMPTASARNVTTA